MIRVADEISLLSRNQKTALHALVDQALIRSDPTPPIPLSTNCPNCGAVVNPSNYKCEYCDTPYSWTTNYEKENKISRAFERQRLTHERLRLENELLTAKTKALADAEEIKVLYEEALRAMRRYADD